jgi:hypothetical protein
MKSVHRCEDDGGLGVIFGLAVSSLFRHNGPGPISGQAPPLTLTGALKHHNLTEGGAEVGAGGAKVMAGGADVGAGGAEVFGPWRGGRQW